MFGVVHVDRPSKVREELATYTDDVDALFIEQPETDVTLWKFAHAFVRTPLFLLGAFVHLVLLTPLYAALHRTHQEAEVVATRRVGEMQELPVHEIDDHPLLYMSRAGPRWILINWATLATLFWLFPHSVFFVLDSVMMATALLFIVIGYRRLWLACALPFTWVILWGVLWYAGMWNLLSVGILVFVYLFYLASVLRIHSHRNEHMLRRVREISKREGYETACLVTGKAHLSGLVRLASDFDIPVSRVHTSKWLRTSDDVVENPSPETMDLNVALPWLLNPFR